MPLEEAIGWLRLAGYSVLRFFPTDRHPTRLEIPGLGSIPVTHRRVPVKYLPLRTEPPPLTTEEILALFDLSPTLSPSVSADLA